MSTETAPAEPKPAGPAPAAPPTQSELLVEERLRQTQRQLAAVEIADGVIVLVGGVLLYLLAAALVDHWLLPGGVGFVGRLVLFLVLFASAGAYFAARILPLLLRRIHPLFAAKTIEASRPGLKNSLVNFLFLRQSPQPTSDLLTRRMYQGVQNKAAADVARLDVHATVDRTPAIHHGYALAGVLAVVALYLIFSPKNPLVSFQRIVWPWAKVPAPTRVAIDDIQPGDMTAFQGDTITISGRVEGLRPDDSALVYYTTADGQSVDQAVPLTLPDGGYRHLCNLPPGGSGLKQDLTYYLAAGDFRSDVYTIQVEIAPAILVDRVRYDYPDYTGLADRTVSGVGDLRALEGTRATIHAAANQPIRTAVIELDCDPRRPLNMTAQGTTATRQLTLAMRRDDPAMPQCESYQIRFTDAAGNENRRPIRHRVEVIVDRPPQIHLVDPPPEAIELPVDGVLELRVAAEDPDFALRQVTLRAEREGRGLPIRPLLEKRPPEAAHDGPFEGSFRLEPNRLGLNVGDVVDYWAEAFDNQEDATGPTPNRGLTPTRRITIVPADGQSRDGTQQGSPSAEDPPSDDQQGPSQSQPERADPSALDEGEGSPQESPEALPEESPQEGGPSDEGQPQDEGSEPSESPQDGSPQDQPGQEGSEGGTSPQTPEQPEPGQQGDGDQSGPGPEGSEGAGGEPASEPIDGDTNPGDAFEEILEHRAENEPNSEQEGSQAAPQPGETPQGPPEPGDTPGQGPRQDQVGAPSPDQPPSENPGPSKPGEAPGGNPSADRESPAQEVKDPGGQGERTNQRAEGHEQEGEGTGEQPTPAGSEGQPQMTPDNEQAENQPGQAQDESAAGQGAQSKGAGEPIEEKPNQTGPSESEAEGGDPTGQQGEGGAGKPSTDPKGSPSAQEGNQPRDMGDGGSPDQGESQESESQSPSISPKQSDSQGETAGDRSGGGEKGGGQKSDQEGTGTAGTHTDSEQGGSRSEQQGEGETGSGAGDQAKADRPTGRSQGEEKGPGSATAKRPGDGGTGEKVEPDQTASGDGPSSPADQSGSGNAEALDPEAQGPSSSGNPVTGGKPGERTAQSSSREGGPLGGDDVNLDYARQQTELALEYLEDQLAREEPDPELLDRLGWTRDELESFTRRWQQMRRNAKAPTDGGAAAERNLDEALRSLGLRPRSTGVRGGGTTEDDVRRLKDSGRHEAPGRWKELFEAYTRSISSSGE